MRAFICRYVPAAIGVLLFYSGVYKAIYPGEAVMALDSLDVNHRLAVATVSGVTGLEIYLGIILLFKADLSYGLTATSVLLLAFTVFLAYLSTLAHPPSCGCMGLKATFNSNRANALFGLLRNCVLLWLVQGAREYYFPPQTRPKALAAPVSAGAGGTRAT
jgi:hypothetical protein